MTERYATTIKTVIYIVLYWHIYSITKQQRQQHVYDYVATNPLASGVYSHQVKKSTSSNDKSIAMDTNPAYNVFTNNNTKDEDKGLEYEIVDSPFRQIKTDDIKMHENPAYAETKFN